MEYIAADKSECSLKVERGKDSGAPGIGSFFENMPSRLIEKNERMRVGRDRKRDFLQMKRHGFTVEREPRTRERCRGRLL